MLSYYTQGDARPTKLFIIFGWVKAMGNCSEKFFRWHRLPAGEARTPALPTFHVLRLDRDRPLRNCSKTYRG
jgi:hypothetical protein